MKINDFLERLRDSVLICDGAMGSMLHDALGPQRCFDDANRSHPEAVFAVHQAYIQAGARIMETNTFGANRLRLAEEGLADQVTRINHAGVKIAREAREAAPHEVLIAGSVGPLGVVRHARDVPYDEMRDIFREQTAALEERGVDLFLLETFTDVEEILAAIDAIRGFSSLPIVAEMTFSEEGTAFDGTRPSEIAARILEKDVQVIGTNCTVGPQSVLPMLQELATAANGRPLSAMPNAGFPKRVGDRIVYPKSSPDYFALFAREAAAIGARIIGGCCGTTPDHIRAMAEAVKDLRPSKAAPAGARIEVEAPPEPRRIATREPESKLWKKIQEKKFVTSVEIDPPKGVSLERIFEQVDKVMASGQVDAIDINSGTLARVGMDATMLAGALEARGIETIPHLTTRDLNIIGLQAVLLGAWSVGGVRNVLAITGDPP
ncbi:MAG TPA: homocysteine S-methyltransferase family protein, partial [Candidatus Acidoferrales bacterium]